MSIAFFTTLDLCSMTHLMEGQDTPVQIPLEGIVSVQEPSGVTGNKVFPHHVHRCGSVEVGEVPDDHQIQEKPFENECMSVKRKVKTVNQCIGNGYI